MRNNIILSLSNDIKIYRHKHNEQGVALVVVLLFLILIMLAGVMAVRQSHTDLKTATADQINTTLLQSSDSPNEKMEAIVNGPVTSQDYKDMVILSTGMFGHFMNNSDNAGDEYVYCYNPRSRKYQINSATVYDKEGGTISNNGICDYKNGDDYTSERHTIMTQVSVTTPPVTANTGVFEYMPEGRDSNTSIGQKNNFDIRSTSAIPSYSEPLSKEKSNCFGLPSAKLGTTSAADAVLDCLNSANTPSKMVYTNVTVENKPVPLNCIPLGKIPKGYKSATGC